MKSITYMLKGIPRTLDDCMDYARQTQAPDGIVLELETREAYGEEYMMLVMQGRYTWSFPDRCVMCASEYGALLLSDSSACRRRKIRQVNARLTQELAAVRAAGHAVAAERSAFTYETDVRRYCDKKQGGRRV